MVAHDPIKGMVTNPRPRLLHPNDWISRLHCCVIPEGSLGTSSLNRDLGTFFLFFFFNPVKLHHYPPYNDEIQLVRVYEAA